MIVNFDILVGQHALTGHKVAIKIMNKKKIKQQNVFEKVKREIKVLRQFNHPHIIKHFEFIDTASDIFMVIEHASGGELFDYISKKDRLSEDEARHFFRQLYSSMWYVHKHKIAHRDLKPENLLLDQEQRNIKLIDFGLSNLMKDSHSLKTACGSPNYAAPEVVSGRSYGGVEADIWSMGVILFAMVCGSLPFDDDSVTKLFTLIKESKYQMPNFISEEAQDLIMRMLQPNPIKRLNMKEIREHEWFLGVNSKSSQIVQLPQYLCLWDRGYIQSEHGIDEHIVEQLFEIGLRTEGLTKDDIIRQVKDKKNTEITGCYELYYHDKIQKLCKQTDLQQLQRGFQRLNLNNHQCIKSSISNQQQNEGITDQKLNQHLKQTHQERLQRISQRLSSGHLPKRKTLRSRFSFNTNKDSSTSLKTFTAITNRMNSQNSTQADTVYSDRFSDLSQNLKDLQNSLKAEYLPNSQGYLGQPTWQFGLKIQSDLTEIIELIANKLKELDLEWQFMRKDKKFKVKTCETQCDLDTFSSFELYQCNEYKRSEVKFYVNLFKSSPYDSSGDYILVDVSFLKGSPMVFADFAQDLITLIKKQCTQISPDVYSIDSSITQQDDLDQLRINAAGRDYSVKDKYALNKMRKQTYDSVNYQKLQLLE
eukprot:403347765